MPAVPRGAALHPPLSPLSAFVPELVAVQVPLAEHTLPEVQSAIESHETRQAPLGSHL